MTPEGPAGGGRDVRYARSLSPADVGRRVVVRRRLPEGGLGDLLGVLESWADGRLAVRDRHGRLHDVALEDVVAGKPVPQPPERR